LVGIPTHGWNIKIHKKAVEKSFENIENFFEKPIAFYQML